MGDRDWRSEGVDGTLREKVGHEIQPWGYCTARRSVWLCTWV